MTLKLLLLKVHTQHISALVTTAGSMNYLNGVPRDLPSKHVLPFICSHHSRICNPSACNHAFTSEFLSNSGFNSLSLSWWLSFLPLSLSSLYELQRRWRLHVRAGDCESVSIILHFKLFVFTSRLYHFLISNFLYLREAFLIFFYFQLFVFLSIFSKFSTLWFFQH